MYKITSRYLEQESFRNSPHLGIDLKMETGEPLRAIQEGVIRVVDFKNKLSGKTVIIDTQDGKSLVYGHLSDFTVKNNDIVHVGDLIGHAGNTGFSTGSHLHFGVKQGGKFIDPSSYIDKIQNMNVPDYLASHTQTVHFNFLEYFQQHMNLVTDQLINLKVNLIHFLTSSDYSPLVKVLQNVIQFIFFNS